jgi:hypothetical protein
MAHSRTLFRATRKMNKSKSTPESFVKKKQLSSPLPTESKISHALLLPSVIQQCPQSHLHRHCHDDQLASTTQGALYYTALKYPRHDAAVFRSRIMREDHGASSSLSKSMALPTAHCTLHPISSHPRAPDWLSRSLPRSEGSEIPPSRHVWSTQNILLRRWWCRRSPWRSCACGYAPGAATRAARGYEVWTRPGSSPSTWRTRT